MTDAFEFFPIPDDMKDHLRQERDKAEMANDMYRHEVQRLFEELSVEHLATLRKMLYVITVAQQPRLCATHYEGYAAAVLGVKYKVCTGCGVNHDEEAMDKFVAPQPSVEDFDGQLTIEFPPPETDSSWGDRQEGKHPIADNTVGWTAEEEADMLKYNIDDTWNQDTGSFIGFICKGCGMVYSSIEDRKLREPDECSGCIQKTKWG